jgi:dinuclear metal center YbgI/SA1388 family protein
VLLADIVKYLDGYLRIAEVSDWPNALNGLQLENSGSVTRIGAAVDASTRSFFMAAERGVDLLIVHHGLFWAGLQPVTGALHRLLTLALQHNIAVYSAHLPLDVHPDVGNNGQLSSALGLRALQRFLPTKGQEIGLFVDTSIDRQELQRRLEQAVGGRVTSFMGGPAQTRRIGVVTGGAGGEIYEVARSGVDTFITGEAPHWAAVAAEELGINLLLGGHYATETFGPKALAAHVAKRFGISWDFLDCPSGL